MGSAVIIRAPQRAKTFKSSCPKSWELSWELSWEPSLERQWELSLEERSAPWVWARKSGAARVWRRLWAWPQVSPKDRRVCRAVGVAGRERWAAPQLARRLLPSGRYKVRRFWPAPKMRSKPARSRRPKQRRAPERERKWDVSWFLERDSRRRATSNFINSGKREG